MKIKHYLLLFFLIIAGTIKADPQQLVEADIILSPDEQIKKALNNNDLILFVEIMKKVKLDKVPLEVILKNQDKYLKKITNKIEDSIDHISGPYTIGEWLKLTGGSLATLACLGLFAAIVTHGKGPDVGEAGGSCLLLSFLAAYGTAKVALRDFTKSDLVKLKKIKKLLKASLSWTPTQAQAVPK